MFWEYLKNINDENTDILVTLNDSKTEYYDDIKQKTDGVFVIENKGMDFGPFLYVLDRIKNDSYNTITKLHGKAKGGLQLQKNNKFVDCNEWMKLLIEPLVGNKSIYSKLISIFENDDSIFYAGGELLYRLEEYNHRCSVECWKEFSELNKILGIPSLERTEFFAGSMFTASKNYLNLFFKDKELSIYEKMNFEYKATSTLAHALERYVGGYVNYYNGKILCIKNDK
jgi:hypothetical protein